MQRVLLRRDKFGTGHDIDRARAIGVVPDQFDDPRRPLTASSRKILSTTGKKQSFASSFCHSCGLADLILLRLKLGPSRVECVDGILRRFYLSQRHLQAHCVSNHLL